MNRRQQCEELWRQKFDEFEASEHFDFIGRDWGSDHGRLASVRCKSCGHEFKTWNIEAYLRGRLKTFWCPECGMKSDGTVQWTKSKIYDEVFDYYLQGHTCREICEKYGISIVQFDNERRIRGITKSEEQRKQSWAASLKKGSEKSNETKKMRAKQNRIDRLDSLGFDYVSESDKKGRVRCRKCGFEFERTFQNLRCGNVVCSECAKVQKAAEEQARKKEQEELKAKQEAERIAKNPLGLSSYQLSIQEKYDAIHVCEVCGKQYTLRERMQNGDTKYCRDSGCCSNECTKKRARKAQKIRERGYRNHKGRARKYGCAFDSSVTLKALVRRNGLRCAICGEMCDPNDHEWTKHFGPTSPTIDHIIPMAKGGGHIWDNVQVAHAICNSTKGAQYE
jgi:5-methylcytosine-specific restriction endonuclease McrA/predicted Zn-ribbon and HTH transcriptional regulator